MSEPPDVTAADADAPETPPAVGPSATATSPERGVHPGVQIGWMVGRVFNAFFLATMAGFAELSAARFLPWPPPLLGLLVFMATLVLGLWHARALYTSWRWALRADDVMARFGVVWRVTRSVPRVRVQHVDVRSGPIDRALGLVEVSLHVAGSAGPVLVIPGLDPKEAETLRQALLDSAKVS